MVLEAVSAVEKAKVSSSNFCLVIGKDVLAKHCSTHTAPEQKQNSSAQRPAGLGGAHWEWGDGWSKVRRSAGAVL